MIQDNSSQLIRLMLSTATCIPETPSAHSEKLIQQLRGYLSESCLLDSWSAVAVSEQIWRATVSHDQERFLLGKSVLEQMPQQHFGVLDKFHSATNYEHTVGALNRICRVCATESLLLGNTGIKALNDLKRGFEQDMRDANHHTFGADELIPVLLFSISRAQGAHYLVAFVQFLGEVTNSTALQGEVGYYLSVLDACIKYVEQASDTAVDEEIEHQTELSSID